jgi:WhiB family transcriptional regulator, redox-sensing transcriptional regulator
VALAWQAVNVDTDADDVWFQGDPAEAFALPSLVELLERPAWHARAACRGQGPDAFFVERGESSQPAKELCDGCEVRAECLSDALEVPVAADAGIWGGLSARQRRLARRSAA